MELAHPRRNDNHTLFLMASSQVPPQGVSAKTILGREEWSMRAETSESKLKVLKKWIFCLFTGHIGPFSKLG